MPERHTGQNICDQLKTVVNEWCIREDCISSVVHDNASNAVCCLELTGWPHFGCVAHTLQLCVNWARNFCNKSNDKCLQENCRPL